MDCHNELKRAFWSPQITSDLRHLTLKSPVAYSKRVLISFELDRKDTTVDVRCRKLTTTGLYVRRAEKIYLSAYTCNTVYLSPPHFSVTHVLFSTTTWHGFRCIRFIVTFYVYSTRYLASYLNTNRSVLLGKLVFIESALRAKDYLFWVLTDITETKFEFQPIDPVAEVHIKFLGTYVYKKQNI